MKKLVAALLLAIYLFSIGGQLFMRQYAEYLSHRFFVEQTGKGLYNTHDLTLVKLPVNLATITDWKDFEDIKGCIRFRDVSYNYVKMKLTRTAMYLLCVPNYQTTCLSHQNIINAGQAGHVPVPQKDHVPQGKLAFVGKINFVFSRFEFSPLGKILKNAAVHAVQHIPSRHSDIPKQPPKLLC